MADFTLLDRSLDGHDHFSFELCKFLKLGNVESSQILNCSIKITLIQHTAELLSYLDGNKVTRE